MSVPADTTSLGRFRWKICGLLGVGAFVNYVDRVNLSIAAQPLAEELGLSASQLGILFSAFLWSYAALQIPIGSLVDRIGIKRVLRTSTVLWGVSTLLTALAGSIGWLFLARLLLGIAEAPMMPAAWKATGYWFPHGERGRSTTIIDGATKLSNVLGIPVMALVIALYGWRAAFFLTAAISALYALFFWWMYRDPSEALRANRLSPSEYEMMIRGGAEKEGAANDSPDGGCSVGYLLRRRKTWGVAIGYASYTYAYYMLLTWLPGYAAKQLRMDVFASGLYTSLSWVIALGVQACVAGWLVDRLIRLGKDPVRVRRTVLAVSMVLSLAMVGAAFTESKLAAIACISLGAAGLAVSAPTGQSIVALIAPAGSAAKLGGIVNFVANLIGIAAPVVTGFIVERTGSFAWGFITAGLGITAGILGYTVVLGRIERMPAPEAGGKLP